MKWDQKAKVFELILKDTPESRPYNGHAERLDDGRYRVTICTPTPRTTIKHELSHIEDFVNNRYYISSFPNLFGWVASEIKAQDSSIED